MAVHRELGPGLLESTYEACLVYELAKRGLAVERYTPLNQRLKQNSLLCVLCALCGELLQVKLWE